MVLKSGFAILVLHEIGLAKVVLCNRFMTGKMREFGSVKKVLWEIGSISPQMNEIKSAKLVLRKTGSAKLVLHEIGLPKVVLCDSFMTGHMKEI